MDNLDNYVPSGWKRDLLHIVGCHYACQITPLDSQEWEKDSQEFLQAMELCKDKEWLAIKELEPLNFMGYMAEAFQQITSHYLDGLRDYTGWIRAGGYYHWRVARLKQLKNCPHLKGTPVPKGPMAWSSSKQQPRQPHRPHQPETATTSASRWVNGPIT